MYLCAPDIINGIDFLCEISLIEKPIYIVQCTETIVSVGRVQTLPSRNSSSEKYRLADGDHSGQMETQVFGTFKTSNIPLFNNPSLLHILSPLGFF